MPRPLRIFKLCPLNSGPPGPRLRVELVRADPVGVAGQSDDPATVLPLVQRVMTEDEMAGVERAIQKGYRLRDTPFMIGWVTDGLPPAALERFFAFSGGPFKILYAVVCRGYARREQRAFRHVGLPTQTSGQMS